MVKAELDGPFITRHVLAILILKPVQIWKINNTIFKQFCFFVNSDFVFYYFLIFWLEKFTLNVFWRIISDGRKYPSYVQHSILFTL